jgi:hypothetical protein
MAAGRVAEAHRILWLSAVTTRDRPGLQVDVTDGTAEHNA